MGVRIPGKLVFLEHPRTGSTGIRKALINMGGEAYPRHTLVGKRKDEVVIGTVRNPYDTLVSWYINLGYKVGYVSFRRFLETCHMRFMVQKGKLFYFVDHIDYVMKFEKLEEHFNQYLRYAKVECPYIELPIVNPTHGKVDYKAYYNTVTRRIAEKKFGREAARFGYTFDGLEEVPRHADVSL